MKKTAGRPPRSDAEIVAFQGKVAKQALALYRLEGFGAVSIRRLAKEVGCAPMTIYAHFDGKTGILRHLWADVLAELIARIEENLVPITDPVERLKTASYSFVDYWTQHPDHFRLVFMSNDVVRTDVSKFVADPVILGHFQLIEDLVRDVLPSGDDARSRTDALVAGMIGIALCHNTIRDYPWSQTHVMTEHLLLFARR